MKYSVFFLIIFISLFACEEKKDPKADKIVSKKALYDAALENKDPNTAIVALNELILLEPEVMDHKDSLCRLYIKGGNYKGGVQLAEKVIAGNKANNKLLELVGVAYQQIKEYEKAIELFNRLFDDTKDYRYAYQVAAITYETGDKATFNSLTDKLLKDVKEDSAVAATLIEFGGPLSGNPQQIPLEAATLFLKGKFAFDQTQDLKTAIAYYQKSIDAFGQFEMPYYYLQEIEVRRRQGQL